MGPHVQFLEGALGFAGGLIEGIVGGKSEPLHPHAQAGEEAEVAPENLSKPIGLGRGNVRGIHSQGSVYRQSGARRWQETGFES